jgi:hypothetical protein
MSTPQTRLSAPASAAAGHIDVLLAGAGISGIGAGYRLKTRLPGPTFLILDAREGIGGTWDLFRYLAVRSDSDLDTFPTSSSPEPATTAGSGSMGRPSGSARMARSPTAGSRPASTALVTSDLRRHQLRRTWSPARRARTEGTAGD